MTPEMERRHRIMLLLTRRRMEKPDCPLRKAQQLGWAYGASLRRLHSLAQRYREDGQWARDRRVLATMTEAERRARWMGVWPKEERHNVT